MKTLYQILEVSETASDEVIEKAYKVLVKKYHPDLQPEGQKQAAEQTMKKLNEAYDVLGNPIKRKEYDEKLALQRQKEEDEQNNLNQTTNSYSNSYAQNNENNQQYNEQYQRQYHEQNQEQYKEQYQRQYEKQYYEAKRKAEQRARQEEARRKQNAMNAEQKMQEELRKSYEAQYQNAYENYLRSLGYKIKHKWTLKNYKEFFLSILILAVICLILWLFPPTHEWLVDFYNSNAIIKIIIDVIGKILTVIWNTIKSFFGKS